MKDLANFTAWALIVVAPLMGAAALALPETFLNDGAWIATTVLSLVALAVLLQVAILRRCHIKCNQPNFRDRAAG
jgi:amino acid permease